MRKEWLEDKEDESLQQHLTSIGCPVLEASVKVDRTSKVWRTVDEADDEERPSELSRGVADDELMVVPEGGENGLPASDHNDTDDELWYSDWRADKRGVCRGEREAVLGSERKVWDPVAWALATSSGSMEEDPSERKLCRHGAKEWVHTAPKAKGGEPMEAQWERSSSSSWRPRNDKGLAMAVRTVQENDGGAAAEWQPMAAGRVRAMAKALVDKEMVQTRANRAIEEATVRRRLWAKEYSSEEPQPMDEAARNYAEWAAGGREGGNATTSTFQPCDEYEGSRWGWLFKKGAAGLGYYKDGVPEKQPVQLSTLLWPTANVEPVRLELSKMLEVQVTIGNPVKATFEDEVVKQDKKKSKKDKKESARGSPAGNSPVNQFLKETMVNFGDATHRDEGWWAVDSVNPNAWPGAVEAMSSSAADFLTVQEAKVETGAVADAESAARGKGWRAAIAPCNFAEGGGKSAGVMAACRGHIGMQESFENERLPQELAGRFTAKHMGAICKGGFHLATGYLHCSVGVQHKSNLDYLQAAAGVLNGLDGPWIMSADWQCTPEQLEATGWLKLVKGRIVAPKFDTCNGRTIDYFVVSESFAGAVVGAVVVGDALCKPHKPVRLLLRARPRAMTVRVLKSLTTFGAKQPFGPAVDYSYDPKDEEGLDLGQRYRLFLGRMEAELVSLAAMDEKQMKAAMGREEGPKFVQQCAMGEQVQSQRRTTAVSRAWRRTAGWLDDMLKTKKAVARAVAERKTLTYEHPAPEWVKATQEQKDAYRDFQKWRELLTKQRLQHVMWVEAFRDVARKEAEKQERAAQYASFKKWELWIHEGGAGGLRRQHQFSRVANGWAPTKRSTGQTCDTAEEDEIDELDGLSREDIDALRFEQGSVGTPATVQQEADDQATKWSGQWGLTWILKSCSGRATSTTRSWPRWSLKRCSMRAGPSRTTLGLDGTGFILKCCSGCPNRWLRRSL